MEFDQFYNFNVTVCDNVLMQHFKKNVEQC